MVDKHIDINKAFYYFSYLLTYTRVMIKCYEVKVWALIELKLVSQDANNC